MSKNKLLIDLHKADEETLVNTLAMLIAGLAGKPLGAALVRVSESYETKMIGVSTLRTILLALATLLPDIEESTDEN